MAFGAAPLNPLGDYTARRMQPLAQGAQTAAKGGREAQLRDACQAMEAEFLSMLWKEMRKTVNKGDLFHGGFGEEMFTQMLDYETAKLCAKGGQLGIAGMLEQQLRPSGPARRDQAIGQYMRNRAAAPAAPAATAATAGESAAAQTPGHQMPVAGQLTSGFGSRVHPITGVTRDHQGIDLAAAEGTPVAASQAGTVVFAGVKGDYGKLVEVRHDDGSHTRYAHLSAIKVAEGQRVSQGQEVGQVGSTGLSTGPHLHFEIVSARGTALDPMLQMAGGEDVATA